MSTGSRAERQAAHLERQGKVMQRVIEGWSIREIAAEVGLSKSQVHRMARAALDRYVPDQYGNRTQMLARELMLLDVLTRTNLSMASAGDWQAARTVIKAHERRCRLLGLDAPTRTKHEFSTAIDREIEELVAELGGMAG